MISKRKGENKGTGSWKDILTFLYLCQSPCPERAHAWRKLKATALHSALLTIQAKRSFEVNSQPAPVVGGFIFFLSQRHVHTGPGQLVWRAGTPWGPPWTCRAMGGFLGERVPMKWLSSGSRRGFQGTIYIPRAGSGKLTSP